MLPRIFCDLPITHRAFHDLDAGRPENSRAAIRAAMDAGYGIEIDLQLSADGQAMVFHDYALDRLTDETGAVRQRSAAELSAIALKGGDGEGIPTLTEVLALVAGRVPLLIELKDQDGAMGTDIGALEAATVAALQGYGGDVALMSFNPHSVAKLAELAPEIPRGLTTSSYDPAQWPLSETLCEHAARASPISTARGRSSSAMNAPMPPVPVYRNCAPKGVPILSWTIRSAGRRGRSAQTCGQYHL